MMKNKIIENPNYWLDQFQNKLYHELVCYMNENNINQTELAEKLGVTKSYVSQLINGNFNFTIKKYIEISLAIDRIPLLDFKEKSLYLKGQNAQKHDKAQISVKVSSSTNSTRPFELISKSNNFKLKESSKLSYLLNNDKIACNADMLEY